MKRPLLISGIVLGGLLMLGPIVGVLGTVFGMQRAFEVLGASGMTDPEHLSSAIGEVLVASFVGLVAFPIGLLIAGVCTVFLVQDKRKTPPPLSGHSVPPGNPSI